MQSIRALEPRVRPASARRCIANYVRAVLPRVAPILLCEAGLLRVCENVECEGREAAVSSDAFGLGRGRLF